MAIPMLPYRPTTQNHRVDSYEIANEEQPRTYSSEQLPSSQEMDTLI